jgi:HlyD family secretion protein
MSNPLFRESALQSLSSPEQLDQLIKITRPRSWIALSTIGFILLATLIWSVFGTLPTNLKGAGLIIRKAGAFNIVALGNGIVTDFDELKVGDTVHKDQIIGHIAQPNLLQQIKATKASLNLLVKANATILAEVNLQKPAQNSSIKQQIAIQKSIIAANQEALLVQNRTLQLQASLLKDGLIVQTQYEETLQGVFASQNKIDTAKNVLQSLVIQSISNQGQYQDTIRQSDTALLQARNQLESLQQQYSLASNLVSPLEGVVTEKLVLLGDIVNANQAVLTLESPKRDYLAIVYIPISAGPKRIKPGMDVQVSLNAFAKERYGYLQGKVTTMSKYSSTKQGMIAVIKNTDAVQSMKASGPVFSVQIELLHDKSTLSGYQWSSTAGSQIDFTSGSDCMGLITVGQQKPISLIIPILKTMTGF